MISQVTYQYWDIGDNGHFYWEVGGTPWSMPLWSNNSFLWVNARPQIRQVNGSSLLITAFVVDMSHLLRANL
jgi:hypothetical protein